MAPDQIVFIVDDDRRVRESLVELLEAAGLHAVAFGSAAAYLASAAPGVPACLILDLELPDINGLELQGRIGQGPHPHIVFISGHGDIPSSVQAMKAGAVDFLPKPFEAEELLRAVHSALAENREALRREAEVVHLRRRFDLLTPREREVLPLVASGRLNKQAAAELGISEVTLQIHRGSIMRKMQAASLPDLVRMATSLAIPVVPTRHARG